MSRRSLYLDLALLDYSVSFADEARNLTGDVVEHYMVNDFLRSGDVGARLREEFFRIAAVNIAFAAVEGHQEMA